MAIRVLQLGTKRLPGEGLRIGTVRRPPGECPRQSSPGARTHPRVPLMF
jgi:hypothetical protein